VILDEWKITLVIRTTNDQRPDKWDYTELLDLATGAGEQAWIESSGVERSGTESELDSGESVDSRESDQDDDTVRCLACGDPIDYCQGHGEIGDPVGFAILQAHDSEDHTHCHPLACADAPHV
jgi:hypothetical protein